MLLKRPRHPINVREILSHTSGLPFASTIEHPTLDGQPLRVAVVSYAMTPLQSEPGAKYQYSNAGINTAGRIIEVVSGKAYEDFLDKRLFEPLGMKDTTFWPNAEQLSRLARPYRPNASKDGLEETTISQLTYPLDDRKRQPMPAGGLFSTASDVGTFCRMILNGGTLDGKRYLSEDAVKQLATKQTGDEVKDQYGLGWAVGGDTFGHGGALATDMIDRPQARAGDGLPDPARRLPRQGRRGRRRVQECRLRAVRQVEGVIERAIVRARPGSRRTKPRSGLLGSGMTSTVAKPRVPRRRATRSRAPGRKVSWYSTTTRLTCDHASSSPPSTTSISAPSTSIFRRSIVSAPASRTASPRLMQRTTSSSQGSTSSLSKRELLVDLAECFRRSSPGPSETAS